MSIVGLHHVQLTAPAGCEADARRFFGDLLGLPEVEKPESLRAGGGAWFSLGDQELHVGVEQPFSAARKSHPALEVRRGELDRLAQRMIAAGAPVHWDDRLPGYRRFYSEDPWGNRIELLAGC